MYEGRGHDVIILTNQEVVCVYTLRARSNRKASFLESGLSSVIVYAYSFCVGFDAIIFHKP